MEDQDSHRVGRWISELLTGIGLGVLMAIAVLFALRSAGYLSSGVILAVLVAAGAALPACFDFLGQRGLSLWIMDLLMIGVSLLLCLRYAASAGMTEQTRVLMSRPILWLHAAAAAVAIVRLLLKRKRGEAE